MYKNVQKSVPNSLLVGILSAEVTYEAVGVNQGATTAGSPLHEGTNLGTPQPYSGLSCGS